MIEIRIPTLDDHPAMVRQVREAFGGDEYTDERAEQELPLIDFDRFRVADDTRLGRVVGVAGSWTMELTVPGPVPVPMAGVTWVAVSPVSRRQGVLTRMMEAIHTDAAERGEPLAGLIASEATIYGRFGYAIATSTWAVKIDRRLVRFGDGAVAPPGSVRLLPGSDPSLPDEIGPRWDRFRRRRVGEVSRSAAKHRLHVVSRGWATTYALHDDGFACWKITPDWSTAPPSHELRVIDLVASTAEARDALWATIMATDLVGPVVARLAPDDPLPYLLSNPRAVDTGAVGDMLWLKVIDIPAVFGARSYGTDDTVVMEVDGTRWTVGPGGCGRTRKRADIVVEPSVLGALVLGGVSLHTLAAARRLEARSAEVLRRADLLVRTFPGPFCQTGF